MNLAAKIFAAVMLNSAIAAGMPGVLLADDASPAISMKPIEGILFNAGTKRGVGYFYTEQNHCKLVLTVTESVSDPHTFTAVRREADVLAGSPARYDLSEGKLLEFTCAADAKTMTMKQIERFADGAAK